MSTTASYPYWYFIGGGSVPGSILPTYVYAPDIGPTTLEDDHDGTDDGMVAVGDPLSWSRDTLGSGDKTTTLYGFAENGDPVIQVYNSTYSNWSYYQLSYDQSLQGDDIVVTQSGTYTMCFAAGTRIATPNGDRVVEALTTGDKVLTGEGDAVPVKWIGRQTVHSLFAGPRLQPVRIRAGALGDGVPNADLTVTADHGMVIDGLVVNAAALINGTTIAWVSHDELPERITYYHVETAHHDVILANGAPAETFIDYADRTAFDNYQDYLDLYGAEPIIPEMPRPRISAQRLLPDHLRQRFGIVDEDDFELDLPA